MFRTLRIQNQLDRLINYSVSLSLEPTNFGHMIRGTSDAFSDLLEKSEETFENLVVHSSSGLFNLLSKMIGGQVQLFINITFIILILFTILYINYRYSLYRYIFKCLRCQRRSRKLQNRRKIVRQVVDNKFRYK